MDVPELRLADLEHPDGRARWLAPQADMNEVGRSPRSPADAAVRVWASRSALPKWRPGKLGLTGRMLARSKRAWRPRGALRARAGADPGAGAGVFNQPAVADAQVPILLHRPERVEPDATSSPAPVYGRSHRRRPRSIASASSLEDEP